jgi:cell division protein FtsB
LPATRQVHLFDVTDARLDGLEEVVASHEMLHAAWDRMSVGERDALGPLLDAEAAKRTDDKDLTDKLAFYASTEPGERLNELHSILGTEYGSLSPELEKHYSLYFSDRAVVVGLHEKSSAVFVEQQAQITSLTTQINELAAGIDADYLAYNSGYDALSTDVAAFNARAQAGDFSSESAFESERDALISRQSDLDAQYQSISDRHAQYDNLVAQLTNLNAQVDELNRSINITPRTAPSL